MPSHSNRSFMASSHSPPLNSDSNQPTPLSLPQNSSASYSSIQKPFRAPIRILTPVMHMVLQTRSTTRCPAPARVEHWQEASPTLATHPTPSRLHSAGAPRTRSLRVHFLWLGGQQQQAHCSMTHTRRSDHQRRTPSTRPPYMHPLTCSCAHRLTPHHMRTCIQTCSQTCTRVPSLEVGLTSRISNWVLSRELSSFLGLNRSRRISSSNYGTSFPRGRSH